jgi:integrase
MPSKTLTSRRTPGIEPRHARSCAAKGWDETSVCTCSPTFQAAVYVARDGKLVRKTFPTISAAKSWRADSAHAVKRGTMGAPTKQTIGAGLDAMLEGMKSGSVRNRNRKTFKPSAIRSYEAVVDARLRQTFGNRKLTDLHRNDVQDYAEELLSEDLDPSTVRNVLMPLRVLYRIAIRRGEVAVNPTHDLELPAVEGTRERVADPGEAQTLLEALPEKDRALWATAFYAGLRNGELRALRVDDVDLEAGLLRVERSWDDVEGAVDPKSKAGARTIPICEHLRGYLATVIESRQEGLLFGETPQRPYNYGKTTRRAYSAWTKANLERITLHNGRHSFRSYLDYAGISEARCDRYLGHANHSVGRRYTHAFESQLALDAALLDAYLGGATAGKVVPLSATG